MAAILADSLTTERSLDHQIMWRYLRQLLDRLAGVLDDEVSDECVDIVIDLLGADRGFVLMSAADGSTRVVNARAQSKSLLAAEREEISRTIVREAIDSGKLACWNQLESITGTASVTHLGIVASMAAPIPPARAGALPRGSSTSISQSCARPQQSTRRVFAGRCGRHGEPARPARSRARDS